MSVELAVLIGLIFVGASATIAAAAIIRRFKTISEKAATWWAGLAIPTFLALGALSQLLGSGVDVDGPPPGMVMAGAFITAVALAPVTLALSFLTVRFLSRNRLEDVL